MRVPGTIWEQKSTLFLNNPRRGDSGENIKSLAVPDEATNYKHISANFKSTILQVHNYSPYNVLCLPWLFWRAITASISIYKPFQEALVLVCEIYMAEFTANASVVELFSFENLKICFFFFAVINLNCLSRIRNLLYNCKELKLLISFN